MKSIRERVLRGSAWTMIGFALAQGLRLASNVVLTHFLLPDVFGIMALLLTVLTGISLFTDLGLVPAIIQSKRGDDERFLNTAWTLQVGRGLFIWLVLCAISVPVARYYHHPDLKIYLPVSGFVAVIGALHSTSIYSLTRHLGARTLTTMNLLMQVVSMAVTIVWAAIHPSIWAMIAGQLVGPLVYVIVSHYLDTGETPRRRVRNRITWDPASASELFHFGKWIFVCTILFYLQSQVDRLVFDKVFKDLWLLGLYAVALQLAQLPAQIIGSLVSAMIMPALAKSAHNIGSLRLVDSRDRILETRRLILPAGVAAMLAVALGAPLFFQLLYKPIYHLAGVLVQYMVPGAWFALLQLSIAGSLQVSGHLRELTFANACNLIFTIIGAVLGAMVGAKHGDARGFILGLGLGNLAGHIVVQATYLRSGISMIGQDLRYTAMLVLLGGAGLLLPRLIPQSSPSHQVVKLILAVLIVSGAGAWSVRRVMLLRPAKQK